MLTAMDKAAAAGGLNCEKVGISLRRQQLPRAGKTHGRMAVPYLITHGANHRQIPLEYAHHSHNQTANSPNCARKTLAKVSAW